MPYDIFRTGPEDKPYCVHKHDEDGEPIGKPLDCHATEAEAEKQLAAVYAQEEKTEAKVAHKGWYAMKALGDWELEVLGVPFGGPDDGKDSQGEFFSHRTDLMLKVGDKRPVLYNHGMDPNNEKMPDPEVIGEAEYIRQDDQGHWFKVTLDQASQYARRIMDAARKGLARASSGAINYLTRILKNTGEILVWPFSELTLIDKLPGKREPANDYAVAQLKGAFDRAGLELPQAFAQAGEAKADAAKGECPCERVRVDPFYLVEARKLRAGGYDGSK